MHAIPTWLTILWGIFALGLLIEISRRLGEMAKILRDCRLTLPESNGSKLSKPDSTADQFEDSCSSNGDAKPLSPEQIFDGLLKKDSIR